MSQHDKRDEESRSDLKLSSEDYYVTDEGLWVFTERYHLKRGYCCQNGCRHCPYGFKKDSGRKTN